MSIELNGTIRIMDTYGKRIRQARIARQMNQSELATKSGIKQPTLSDIETGETKMLEGGTLVAVAAALKVRPDWIMTGKGLMEAAIAPVTDDKLLSQIIVLYENLCDSKKHELARYANYLAAHPLDYTPSTANPFPKVRPKR